GTVGSVLGGAGGGGVTAMVAPRVAAKGVDVVRKGLAPKLKEDDEVRRVAESIFTKDFRDAELYTPRWKENVGQAIKASGQIPGFEPDLGMAAGTESVRKMQEKAEAESASAAARGVTVRENVRRALDEYSTGAFPAGEKTVQELSAVELDSMGNALAQKQAQL